MAFVAARVFRLHDGSTSLDIPVPHRMSSGWWTHSARWDLPAVASAIGTAITAA